MNLYQCSACSARSGAPVWRVLAHVEALPIWVCPNGCGFAKPTKYGRRVCKGAPMNRYLSLGDRLKIRDRAQRRSARFR